MINVNLQFMCAASLYVLKFSELVVVSFMSVSNVHFARRILRGSLHIGGIGQQATRAILSSLYERPRCTFITGFSEFFKTHIYAKGWNNLLIHNTVYVRNHQVNKVEQITHSAFIRKVGQAKSSLSAQVVLQLAVVAQELGQVKYNSNWPSGEAWISWAE